MIIRFADNAFRVYISKVYSYEDIALWPIGYQEMEGFGVLKYGFHVTRKELDIIRTHRGRHLDFDLYLLLYNALKMSGFDSLIGSLR